MFNTMKGYVVKCMNKDNGVWEETASNQHMEKIAKRFYYPIVLLDNMVINKILSRYTRK